MFPHYLIIITVIKENFPRIKNQTPPLPLLPKLPPIFFTEIFHKCSPSMTPSKHNMRTKTAEVII
jgi:hypothetical protein